MDLNKETKKLYEKKATLVESYRELTEKMDKKDFSAEDEQKMTTIETDIDDVEKQIGAKKKLFDLTNTEEERIAEISEDHGEDKEQIKGGEKAYSKAFWKYMLRAQDEGAWDALTPEEKILLTTGEKRAQSVGTNSEGGFLSPQEFSNELAIALKAYGGMREAARVIRTAKGGTLDWPMTDPTANTGAWLGENTQAATTNEVFANITFGAYKASSSFIKVSVELMQDSAFDMAGFVRDRLVERLGRLTNAAFTDGNGSSKPRGMIQLPSSSHTGTNEGVESASTTALAANEIIDLQESVNDAYRKNAKFMFHQSTRKLVRKLKDSEGVYIWQPGLQTNEPDTLLGKPYIINNDMDELSAGNKIMVYGDFSHYVIRSVQDFILLRLNERFADLLQVGFIGFERVDAALVAPNSTTSNPLQHYRITNT